MNFKQKLFNILIEGIEDLPDEDEFGEPCLVCGEKAKEGYGEEACSDKCYMELVNEADNPNEKARLASNFALWHGRQTWADKIVLKAPKMIDHYARHIIKGRWPEGEEILNNIKEPMQGRTAIAHYWEMMRMIGIERE